MLLQSISFYLQLSLCSFDVLYHLIMEEKMNCDLMDIFHDSDGGPNAWYPKGFIHGQASGSQQPPPPPPNLAEVMALQIELLRQLVQGQQNQPRSQQRGRDDHIPPAPGYQDFFGTQPPRCSTRPMNPWMQMHGFGP